MITTTEVVLINGIPVNTGETGSNPSPKFYGLNPEHTLTLEEITALLMASICLNEEEFNALPLRLQQLFTELK